MSRRTFVVHVYGDGRSMLENLGTRERVALVDLREIGTRIERWVAQERRPPPDRPRDLRRS